MEKNLVVFFGGVKNVNGEFNNMFVSNFEVFGHEFCSVDQYVMAQKALIFDDRKSLNEILNSKDPMEIRKLGEGIDVWDVDKWRELEEKIVRRAVVAKFSQNENLKLKLLGTGDRMLVFADPNDKVWGIGYCKSNNKVLEKREKWGKNLLGKILMEVREEFRVE